MTSHQSEDNPAISGTTAVAGEKPAVVSSTPKQWMIDVNARYQKLIDLLISLSTGALILPPIFLQKFLGVTSEPLAMFLDAWALTSIAMFGLTIMIGIGYHWASAKWVKHAWGEPTKLTGFGLERLLDQLFVAGAAAFLLGIVSFLLFVLGN